MTTIRTAHRPAEFLAYLPQMLGFTPRRSLVLVPFIGSRSAGGVRVDLPEPGSDAEAQVASTCVGMVCRVEGADGIAIVVYADGSYQADDPPNAALVDAIRVRADACGLTVIDALWVDQHGWAGFDAGAIVHPLTELDPPEGDSPRQDQYAGATLPPSTGGERAVVRQALDSLERAWALVHDNSHEGRSKDDGPRVDPRAIIAVSDLADVTGLGERILAADVTEVDAWAWATVVWCLHRPAVRDVLLLQWVDGVDAGRAALEAQLRWESGRAYPVELAMRMWGQGGPVDAARLSAALIRARRAAAVSPRRCRAGALATCAWLSWALGRSTHAERYARAAGAINADHGLAEIVLRFTAAGHLPEWAFEAVAQRAI